MQFNLPTTKQEMYVILNDLFYYYRVRREGFEDLNLKELDLQRLEYTPKTDEELEAHARVLLAPEQQREIDNYLADLRAQLEQLSLKKLLVEDNAEKEIEQVEKLFNESVEKIQKQAIKSGLINSSIVVDKTTQLESDKNLRIADIVAKKNKEIVEISITENTLNAKLNQGADIFSVVHEKDVNKKVLELIESREKTVQEVFKYNNGLDEKEQRYANTIKQVNSSLKIRFLAITAGEFTKDQLVDMGYYSDVIRCVTGYYDTLEPITAYQDISAEKKLAIYLDDYYQNIIYGYRMNAGY